jgi:hypothetical protein
MTYQEWKNAHAFRIPQKALEDLDALMNQHDYLRSWSVLAARALDDSFRVFETIEADDSTESEKLQEICTRIFSLFNQALSILGFMTRSQMDKDHPFGALADHEMHRIGCVKHDCAECRARAEQPAQEPPEAPCWFSSEQASAWQCGWTAGYTHGIGGKA